MEFIPGLNVNKQNEIIKRQIRKGRFFLLLFTIEQEELAKFFPVNDQVVNI